MPRSIFYTVVAFIFMVGLVPSSMAAPENQALNEAIDNYNYQDYDKAFSQLNTIVIENPKETTALYYLGLIYEQREDYQQAILHYKVVLGSASPVDGIKNDLARAYVGAKQFDKALPLYEQLYKADPSDENIAIQYASLLKTGGRASDALAIYKSLDMDGGTNANLARFEIGALLADRQSFHSAMTYFKAVEPDSPYGDGAREYMQSLASSTKPVNAYVSVEYFFNDNVSGASTVNKSLAIADTKIGSAGTTLIGSVSSRAFDLSESFSAKLGYLFYGILHTQNKVDGLGGKARDNDFMGHFLNPEIMYRISNTIDVSVKGDLQYFNYKQQKLSNNYGVTATINKTFSEKAHTINANVSYLRKLYTTSFDGLTSLQYLDANAFSLGLGGTLASDWGGSLTLGYTYSLEHPTNMGSKNLTMRSQARDSEFDEHMVTARADISLPDGMPALSIAPSVSFSRKNYKNPMSPSTFYMDRVSGLPLSGIKLDSRTLTYGVEIAYVLLQDYGLSLTVGYERSTSHSKAATLNVKYNKYYGQISGSY